MLKERAKSNPDYHGYEEAIEKFLSIFREGFADGRFIKDEREYKLKARVGDLLKSSDGPAFLQAAAGFTRGDCKPALSSMKALMRNYGQISWPVATYLACLWDPQRHMILKKEVTVDFAKRVGHRFTDDYAGRLIADVYESLLDLVEETDKAIESLESRDRIDMQSFIYVTGRYTEQDAGDIRASKAKLNL